MAKVGIVQGNILKPELPINFVYNLFGLILENVFVVYVLIMEDKKKLMIPFALLHSVLCCIGINKY